MTAIEAPPLSYDSNKPPERIEEDILRTRDRLGATIGELERRLAPRRMIDTAGERLLSSLEADSEQLVAGVRRNSIPLLLVAAGLLWLLFFNRRREAAIGAAAAGADEGGAAMPATGGIEDQSPGIADQIAIVAPEPAPATPALGDAIIGSAADGGAGPLEFDRAAAGEKPAIASPPPSGDAPPPAAVFTGENADESDSPALAPPSSRGDLP